MYDVVVVGGGHAGIEACHIAAKLGKKTLLVTSNFKNVGDMPCNPSIGGTAKGIIVREVDALGGLMGHIADISQIQIKMLNNSKGPAVRSLRAQADKITYPKNMQEALKNTPNLTIKEAMIEDLIVEDNKVLGVITSTGEKIYSKTVILTTGTYLKGNILIGSENTPSGPHGEARSNYLSDKFKLPEDVKLQIYQIVKDHNWLQKYNIKDLNRRKTIAKDIAFDLRKGNSFEMASILTEADMQAVKRNGAFFDGYADILKQGEQEVGEYVRQIKQSAIHLPQTKLPKASELIVDGDKVKEVTTKLTNGTEIKNKVIYLEPNLDLSKYGFSDNLNSDDLNVLIHALNTGEQSTIFQALGQIDSDALLSTSYVNYGQGNYHAFRQQGFILDVDSDDINAGYFRDFGSGYGKTLDKLKENYLFNGSWSQFRTYCSEELKKLLNMDDIEYMKFYEQIKNKSITEIDKEYPQAAAALREFFKKMEGGKRRYGRQYNEMLITRPKIQGVFNYGKSDDISKIPEFLRIYAQENDLPIIYFGK